MEYSAPICFFCERLKVRPEDRTGTCEAFPKAIPDEIFFKAYDHRKKFKGDNNILFKRKEGTTDSELSMYDKK